MRPNEIVHKQGPPSVDYEESDKTSQPELKTINSHSKRAQALMSTYST